MYRFLNIALLLTHGLFFEAVLSAVPEPSTFRAAVYEHIPFLPSSEAQKSSRQNALEVMEKNLKVYKEQTIQAKSQGAQIIVFPEDGLYGYVFSRKSILHFLEKIPNPKVTHWSPCSDPTLFPDSEVQHALSCMAKENSLYVVANMGDWVPCDAKKDPKCPTDGHYQYNTDVAFNPEGYLVAKYHKTHLYSEDQFDTPKAEVVYFDTPFGRFGMLVCFDLLFKDPAVTMVIEKHGIRNIAFPTAWKDTLPPLSAIGYHSSFARGLGINLFSANVHLPAQRFQGSGIYTPDGMSSFYYNHSATSPGKLLVSTVDILNTNYTKWQDGIDNDLSNKIVTKDFKITGNEFQAKLYKDLFTFRLLDGSSGNFSVCQGKVCCSLSYEKSEDGSQKELFAFGAFDGLHSPNGNYYFQTCALVKCADDSDQSKCGKYTRVTNTKFKSLSITGKFQTKFIYPQLIMANDGTLILGDQKSWSFKDTTLVASEGRLTDPLVVAALLGRHYDCDYGKQCTGKGNHGSKVTISLNLLMVLSMVSACFIFCH